MLQRIIQVYAANFTRDNIPAAKAQLMQASNEMRKKDAVLLGFFAGTLLVSCIVTLFTIFMPHENPGDNLIDWEEIVLESPIFRFTFSLILVILFVSIDVMILRRFRVNYMFIFELDPHYKITHI